MRYLKKRRALSDSDLGDEDPLSGVANLFDLALVFIVGLLIMLFGAYGMQDMFSEKSEITITRKSEDDSLEIITKKGRKIKAMKVTKIKTRGRGERLGTAYRLQDGTTVYVPD